MRDTAEGDESSIPTPSVGTIQTFSPGQDGYGFRSPLTVPACCSLHPTVINENNRDRIGDWMKDKIASDCLVCGTSLVGALGLLFQVFGIKRSAHNPNVCNRCEAHMEEGRVIELTVLFADLTGFTAMTNRLGPDRSYEVINAFFQMANKVLIKNDAFIDK